MSDLKDSEPWKAEMLKEAKALLDALVAKQRALEGTDSTQSSNGNASNLGLAKQGSLRLINDLVLEGEQAASCRSLLQENAVTRTENKDSPHERERNSDGDEGKVRIDADLEIIDLADLEQRSNEKFAKDVGKSNEEETKRAIISEADKCSQSFAVNPVLGQAYTEAYQRFGRTASSSFSLRFKQISFTGFSRSNSLRMFCLKLFGSKYWITFHFFLAILHGLCASAIAFMSADHAGSHTLDGRTYDLQSSWMARFNLLNIILIAFLGIEILVGCIALGCINDPHYFLRKSKFHSIDFLIFLSGAVDIILSFFRLTGISLASFRFLRVFRLLRVMNSFERLKWMVLTLDVGLGQMGSALLILVCFVFSFAIFGVSVYQSSFKRRCVQVFIETFACTSVSSDNWSPACQSPLITRYDFSTKPWNVSITGGYQFFKMCNILRNSTPGQYDGLYPLDHKGRYHTCQMNLFQEEGQDSVTEMCETVGNVEELGYFGLMHFDHFFGAVLAISQWIFPDNAYDVLWFSYQSQYQVWFITFLFYPFILILCHWMDLGFFVGIVTETFRRIQPSIVTADEIHNHAADLSDHPVRKNTSISPEQMFAPTLEKIEMNQDEQLLLELAKTLRTNAIYQHFQSLVVISHIITLGLYTYQASATNSNIFFAIIVVCTFIYTVDAWLFFIECRSFLSFLWRARIDLLLLLLAYIGLSPSTRDVFKFSQSFRIFRLCRHFPLLQGLLLTTLKSLGSFLNLAVFSLIWMISFATIGRYLFAGTLDEISRSNFSSVGYAFLTIFQLTAGDSWSRILYSAIHVKETFAGQVSAAIFVYFVLFFCQILLINLLVAIIIQNFTYDVTFKRENEEASQAIQSLRGMFAKTFLKLRKARSNFPVLPSSKNRSRVRPEETNQQDVEVESNPQEQENASVVPLSEPMPATEGSQNQIPLEGGESVRSNASKVSPFDLATHRGLSSKIVLYHSNSRTEEERSDEDDNAKRFYADYACFIFPKSSLFRRIFIRIGESAIFEWFILLCIICSCVFLFTLAPYDDIPNYPYLINSSITNIANLIFNIIFSVESIIRIMNVGFIFSEGAYLRSPWNLLDFVVICISWLQGLVQFQSLSNAKILRLVRALRPLRVMKQNRGMRNTINALVLSLVPLSYIFFFLAFIILAFGIVAMGIFGGKFFSCSDPNVSYPEGKAQCSGTFVNTDNRILYASSWTNQRHNFDDFWTSALTLFKVTTIKYVSVMQNAMDVTSVDVSPLQDAHAENAVFFVTYIAIGSFFIWNLMIGFIVDAFTVNKGITSAEKDLYNFILRVQLHKPKITAHKFPKASMKLRRLIESGPFRMLSLFFIAVNIGFMLSDHSDASDLLIKIIYWQNVSTYILLGIEVILNFLAYGLKGFFVDRWRIFDLVIVLTSFTLLAGPTGSYLQFLKGLRLIRIFRLLNQIRPVRVILETFLLCLPQFINVISMLFLIYVIFAAVAVQLFGITRSGVRIGPTANFDTLGSSFVTCLQILTGDEWQEMLEDLSVQPPFCSYQFSSLYISGYTGKNYSFGDCGFYKTGTTIFFICFKLICEGMLINLFVGMILDNFSFVILEATTNVEAEMDESQGVNQVQLYAHVFRKYDKGTGRLPVNCLEPFMRDLPPPMGFASLSARRHTNERMNRTYLKFIRAELHLIMRERNSSDSKAGSNNFFSYIASQSSGALNPEASILNQFDFNFAWKKSDEFRNAVSWEDLMFTLALWRMPSIIPQRLRDARKARIAEIQEIKHALVIRDFLRRKTIRGKSFKDLRLEKERREMEGEVEKREDEAENDEAKFNDEDDGQVPGDPVEEKKGDGKEGEEREGEETREEVKHDQWKRGERTDQEEEKEMEMNDAEEDMKAFS